MKVRIDFNEHYDANGHDAIPTLIKPKIINAKGMDNASIYINTSVKVDTSVEEIGYINTPIEVDTSVEEVPNSFPYGRGSILAFNKGSYEQTASETISEECYVLVIAHGFGSSSITASGNYDTILTDEITTLGPYKCNIYKCKSSMTVSANANSPSNYQQTSCIIIFKLPIEWNLGNTILYKDTKHDASVRSSDSGIEDNKKYLVICTAVNESTSYSCTCDSGISAAGILFTPYIYECLWAKEIYGSVNRADFLLTLIKGDNITIPTAYAYAWGYTSIRVISTSL